MNDKKAYALGFLLGDSAITKTGRITLKISLKDKEVIYNISKVFENTIIKESYIKNVDKKIFPSIEIAINKKEFPEARMLFGGITKKERNLPILKNNLEVDLLRGFFDAEGCITWGVRKDRDRIWQKVSFNSQLGMLISVQKILQKNKISTIIKPVNKSDHYIIEFADEYDIFKFYNYIYSKPGFYLKRKRHEFECWINAMIKKYDITIGDTVKFVSLSSAVNNLSPDIYLEYKTLMCSRKFKSKNLNVIKDLGHLVLLDGISIPINKLVLTKKGMKLTPLRIELGELLESSKKKQSAAALSETGGSETTGYNSDIV